MKNQDFNYEERFMGVRGSKPKTYRLSFKEDYRLRSLVKAVCSFEGNMLDIGCGGGRFTESIPYYFPKVSMYGCDISSTAVSYAKKLGSGKVRYGVIKNNKFPYKNSFFDACICFDVLEHVPNVDFFLREVKRVLKKEGKFFLIVPCEGERFTYTWLFQKIHLGNNLTLRYLGHIHPEFTHKKVAYLLRKHGFLIQKMTYSEHIFYQLLQFFIFFIPKMLLDFVLGETQANEYTNSSLVKISTSKKNPILDVRNLWCRVWDFMMFYPMNWETILLKNFSPTAWKLHALVIKK